MIKVQAGVAPRNTTHRVLITPEGDAEAALRRALGLTVPATDDRVRIGRRAWADAKSAGIVVLRPAEWASEAERAEAYRMVASEAATFLGSTEVEKVQIGVGGASEALDELAVAVLEGLVLGAYKFERYFDSKTSKIFPKEVWVENGSKTLAKSGRIDRAMAVVDAVITTRNLINTPANDFGPQELEDACRRVARAHGHQIEVLKTAQLRKGGYGGILGVGQGSVREPRLIVVTQKKAKNLPHVVLVGKGVCFDSGGLSLKPPEGMMLMKIDMGGAAVALGTLDAVSRIGLPINVSVIIPAVENMPDATSLRPGDVIRMLNGKTVEVLNTDAEGRLILADGLTHACRMNPDLILDMATLTGMAGQTFGNGVVSPVFTNRDPLRDMLIEAGIDTCERLWPMPLYREYTEAMKGEISDLKNIGKVGMYAAGTITAAAFLQEFVEGRPWAHLDIANMTYAPSDMGYRRKGPTGAGVRLLTRFLEKLSQDPSRLGGPLVPEGNGAKSRRAKTTRRKG